MVRRSHRTPLCPAMSIIGIVIVVLVDQFERVRLVPSRLKRDAVGDALLDPARARHAGFPRDPVRTRVRVVAGRTEADGEHLA